MDKGKGVRKHGRLRQILRWLKYIVQGLIAIQWTLFVVFLMLLGVLCLVKLACMFMSVGDNPDNLPGLYVSISLLVMGAGLISCGAKWMHIILEAPKGTAWKPLPPEENPLLPDEELLVRASSSSAAQPAELLRAAQETKEEKPEELLRAGVEREA